MGKIIGSKYTPAILKIDVTSRVEVKNIADEMIWNDVESAIGFVKHNEKVANLL